MPRTMEHQSDDWGNSPDERREHDQAARGDQVLPRAPIGMLAGIARRDAAGRDKGYQRKQGPVLDVEACAAYNRQFHRRSRHFGNE